MPTVYGHNFILKLNIFFQLNFICLICPFIMGIYSDKTLATTMENNILYIFFVGGTDKILM